MILASFTELVRKMRRDRIWKNSWNCMIRENMKHQAIRQMQSYLHMKGKAVILLTD